MMETAGADQQSKMVALQDDCDNVRMMYRKDQQTGSKYQADFAQLYCNSLLLYKKASKLAAEA